MSMGRNGGRSGEENSEEGTLQEAVFHKETVYRRSLSVYCTVPVCLPNYQEERLLKLLERLGSFFWVWACFFASSNAAGESKSS